MKPPQQRKWRATRVASRALRDACGPTLPRMRLPEGDEGAALVLPGTWTNAGMSFWPTQE